MPFATNGIAPPAVSPFSVGAYSISVRRWLSEWLPPGWEQGAVASPQRPAPQGCLKEKAQSKEDTSASTKENRGKHLIKGKSAPHKRQIVAFIPAGSFHRFAVPRGATAVGGCTVKFAFGE